MLGNVTTAHDPDTGDTTTSYDAANRVTATTDARNTTLAYTYDALDRKTADYTGSTSGTKLAAWTYDTASTPARRRRWRRHHRHLRLPHRRTGPAQRGQHRHHHRRDQRHRHLRLQRSRRDHHPPRPDGRLRPGRAGVHRDCRRNDRERHLHRRR